MMIFSLCCQAADNLVLVTIDGLRWQELFSGIDKMLPKTRNITIDLISSLSSSGMKIQLDAPTN
ncbi:MAG: hypothetical protein ACI9UN_004815 [Granulosicoccus sp.]|jgi:hypothetical protein